MGQTPAGGLLLYLEVLLELCLVLAQQILMLLLELADEQLLLVLLLLLDEEELLLQLPLPHSCIRARLQHTHLCAQVQGRHGLHRHKPFWLHRHWHRQGQKDRAVRIITCSSSANMRAEPQCSPSAPIALNPQRAN